MAIPNYKTDKSMNQIERLSFKGLIVLQKLYIDMVKDETKNEKLNIILMINKELLKRYGQR